MMSHFPPPPWGDEPRPSAPPPNAQKPRHPWPVWTALGLSIAVVLGAVIEAVTRLPTLWIIIPLWLGAVTMAIIGLALRVRPKWPAVVALVVAGSVLLLSLAGLVFIYLLFAAAYS